MTPADRPPLSMKQVLWCGAAIVTLSMGIRHGFGLWLQPITMDRGWSRESFAFALAVQNLVWGLAGPFTGMIADRFGALRVLAVGGLMYAAGLALMAVSATPLAFLGSAVVADRRNSLFALGILLASYPVYRLRRRVSASPSPAAQYLS